MLEEIHVGVPPGVQNDNKRRALAVMLDLILETGTMPVVEDVLDRAGISRRSFFRFFPSESARVLEVNALMRERLRSTVDLPEPDPKRTLKETLRLFVDLKSDVDERRMPMRKLAEAKRGAHPEVEEFLRKSRGAWSRYIDSLFSPHLVGYPDKHACLRHIQFNTSWNVWAILRSDYRMDVATAREFVMRQILAVFDSRQTHRSHHR